MKTAIHVVNRAAPKMPAPKIGIRPERASDIAARETLLDAAFGTNRHARTCQRLRDGCKPAAGLALTAIVNGCFAGTVRLWPVDAGGRAALMLGPLAVAPQFRALGIGSALMRHAIAEASRRGHGAIVLLGDAPYYARFGFAAEKAAALVLPGPFACERLLALELRKGALKGASGMIAAVTEGKVTVLLRKKSRTIVYSVAHAA